MIAFLEKLKTTAWRTYCARYNAARRLSRADSVATFSIAGFSAITIVLAVVQRLYEFSEAADNAATAASIFIGLFVIIISLTESGADNRVKAARLLENAERLNSFHRKLEEELAKIHSGATLTHWYLSACRAEYDNLRTMAQLNHEPIDDQRFLAEHRNAPEFSRNRKPPISFMRAQWIKVLYAANCGGKYLFYWVAILLLVLLIVWS